MTYLNLNLADLDTEQFLDAPREQIATWLLLLRHCAAHENGGRIAGAGAWNEHKCQRVLRCSLAEIREESALWRWEAEALIVENYPVYQEQRLRQKRKAGMHGGVRSGQVRRANGAGAEAPSMAEVAAYAGELPGTLGELTGCPAVDQSWARDWWTWRDNHKTAGWDRMRSWKKALVHDWRRQWKSWQRRQGATTPDGGGPASAFPSERPQAGQKVKVL